MKLPKIVSLFVFAVSLPLCALELLPLDSGSVHSGVLDGNGKKGYARLKDSETLGISRKGFTAAFWVKLRESGSFAGKPEGLDMFLSKDKDFFFGRYGKKLYLNIYDETAKKWNFALMGQVCPPGNKWTHLAFTVSYWSDEAQGDFALVSRIFMNGEQVAEQRKKIQKNRIGKQPLFAGYLPNWNKNWLLNGEMAEIFSVNRPLSRKEIIQKMSSSSRCPAELKAQQYFSDTLQDWLISAAAQRSKELSRRTAEAIRKKGLKAFLKQPVKGLVIRESKDLIVLIASAAGKGHPILGIWDKAAGEMLTCNSGFDWKLKGAFKGNRAEISTADVPGKIIRLSGNKLCVSWKRSTPGIEVLSEIDLGDRRLAGNIQVKNLDPHFLLDEVSFPISRLKKKQGADQLLFPFHCGKLVNDPTVNPFLNNRHGVYPEASASLQFDSYYANKRGVYAAVEDPRGLPKRHRVNAYPGRWLEIDWGHPVPAEVKQSGKNGFKLNGKAVLETFAGEWYESAMIYRRFLEKEAVWYLKKLPRKDTPEWFKSGTLCMNIWPDSEHLAYSLGKDILYLRKYFELPLTVFWNNWHDRKYGQWPHFDNPFKSTVDVMKQFRENDIHTMFYFNPLLWAQKDGPRGKSDWRYSSEGRKYAVKDKNGNVPFYRYRNTANYDNGKFSIECPGSLHWRNFITDVASRVLKRGANALHHDQVGAVQPRFCFDPGHGHKNNDPSVWIENGYAPMIGKIKKQHPETAHGTEDFSERYANIFDGALAWRWTYPDQVPVMQILYRGRIQVLGQSFDNHRRGDGKDFYAKTASHLVYGEWIGCFAPWELRQASFKRLYLKKLMHLRLCLLPYFNFGELLDPIKFKGKVPELRSRWGGFYVPQLVTTPAVVSNSYELGKNRIHLFLNTVDRKITLHPQIKLRKAWRISESASKLETVKTGETLTLKPYAYEVWIDGELAEAERIRQGVRKIAGFRDLGEHLSDLRTLKTNKNLTVQPGRFYTAETVADTYNCEVSGKIIGSFQPGALISYGVADFGTMQADKIKIKLGLDSPGGRFDVQIPGKDKKYKSVGFIKNLPATGGFDRHREFIIPLKQKLSGKVPLRFQYDGNGAWGVCVSGWSVVK